MKQEFRALEELYRRHASAVFRFAWGLCGDPDEAEDIVSETFVRLLTKTPRIRTQTALAYLLAIARNTYLTDRRKKRKEVPIPGGELSSSEPGPAQLLDDQVLLSATIKALHDLPEGERAALLLRVDHNLSYEDIAGSLGISVGAAKVRVHRARMKLSTTVQPKGKAQ